MCTHLGMQRYDKYLIQERPTKPETPWLTDQLWNGCHDLEEILTCFQGITADICTAPIKCVLGKVQVHVNPENWDGYIERTQEHGTEDEEVVTAWNDRLTMFQKLCLIKTFWEEKVRWSFLCRNSLVYAAFIRLYLL